MEFSSPPCSKSLPPTYKKIKAAIKLVAFIFITVPMVCYYNSYWPKTKLQNYIYYKNLIYKFENKKKQKTLCFLLVFCLIH